jgi:phage terminase large subunit
MLTDALQSTTKQKYAKVTPVYRANQRAYKEGYRRIINQGSTRSSKTFSIVQLLIRIALSNNKKEISIVSPSLPHLKMGAMKDFLDIMDDWEFYNDNHFHKTDSIYTFPDTKSTIQFFGAEDAKRVRGPGRDILYINEANLVPEKSYKQMALRTRETVFLDFNPADDYSYVYDLIDKENTKFIHSTYLNNLGNLPQEIIDEIEDLKNADQNLWKVFGLGLRGSSEHTIYTHWTTCPEMPGKGEVFYGLDFGYQNPSALIKIEIHEGICYVDETLYQRKLTTSDLIDELRILGIGRSAEIFADCAEPKTIEEIRREGYNVKESDKDVLAGIRHVRSMPLRVTERSANIIKEIKNYKWKLDRNDKIVTPEQPVKFNDHAMDAIRYAVFTKLTGNHATWVAF